MVDFSNRDEVKRWLDAIKPARRRREVAVALAARAALRVLPLLGRELARSGRKRGGRKRGEVLSALVLPCLRATALPWAAAKYPAHGNDLRAAAYAAADAAANAAANAAAYAADAAANAAANAADAAANAAYAATDAAANAAYANAAANAADAADAAAYADAADAAATAYAADAATVINSGGSGALLAGTALWPNGAPSWATDAWQALKSALLAAHEGWEVWTDWYEARLAGDAAHPANEALELARATIADEFWKQGPAVVNAEIKRLIAEHEKGELVVDDPRASIATANDRDHDKAAFAPILATRAALRALPLLASEGFLLSDVTRLSGLARLSDVTRLSGLARLSGGTDLLHVFATFRALAVAWARVRYDDNVSRQWCVAAGRYLGSYVQGSELERHLAKSAADAAFAAGSETSGAAAARAASAQIEAQHAIALAPDRAAQVAARLANSSDADDVVAGVNPGQVAEVALWPGRDPPPFLLERWNALKESLSAANEGWEVWIDWYEARLDGRLHPKEVELAYVEFIRNVVDSAPARVANAEIKRLINLHTPNPTPSTPATEPGPILEVGEQGLALATPPPLGDFDHSLQSALHERLKRLCPALIEATRRVGNTHPGLKTIVDEYADLVAQPMDAIDAASLWTVGVGLLANRDAFSGLPRAGVMTEPLEPDHLALLEQVAGIHGAFILGLPQGRELTERADQARLTPEILAAILPPSRDLLERWRDAGKIVEDRTRSFFGAVRAAAIEPSWRTARVGYSTYVVTRNALIGVGKLLLIANSIGGTLVVGAALTGVDPSLVEQTRLWIQFVLDHAQTILSFSEPFPELKTWLATIIDELARDRAFRGK